MDMDRALNEPAVFKWGSEAARMWHIKTPFLPSPPNCLLHSSCRAMGLLENNSSKDKDHGASPCAVRVRAHWPVMGTARELVQKTRPQYLERLAATKRSNGCENSIASCSWLPWPMFARFWTWLHAWEHSLFLRDWSLMLQDPEMSYIIAMWHYVSFHP